DDGCRSMRAAQVVVHDLKIGNGVGLGPLREDHVFFFSSRRRHTRWPRDWSSDVCSSDLGGSMRTKEKDKLEKRQKVIEHLEKDEIGRASCRERVEDSGVAAGLKKKRYIGR